MYSRQCVMLRVPARVRYRRFGIGLSRPNRNRFVLSNEIGPGQKPSGNRDYNEESIPPDRDPVPTNQLEHNRKPPAERQVQFSSQQDTTNNVGFELFEFEPFGKVKSSAEVMTHSPLPPLPEEHYLLLDELLEKIYLTHRASFSEIGEREKGLG